MRKASGQLIRYARVSTRQQDLALQLDALNQAGCERIFRDVGSGTRASAPARRGACLEYLRSGDTLVVWRLDRLGRSLRHLVDVIAALEINGYVIERLHKHGRLIGYACARPTPSTRPPHAGASDGADHRDSQQHSKQGARSASVRP